MTTRKTSETGDPLAEAAEANAHFGKVLAAFSEVPPQHREAVRAQFLTATNAYKQRRPRRPRAMPTDDEGPEIPAEDYGG